MKPFVYVSFIVFVIGMYPAEGWVVSELWRWFLEPLGAPHLGIAPAIGLALIGGLLTHQIEPPRRPGEPPTEHAQRLALYFARVPIAYVVGLVVHLLAGAP